MTFFGSLVPFLLAGALYDSRAPLRPLYYIAVGIVFATLAGSMSRSSTGVGICGMLIFWWLTRNRRALGMVAVLGICIGLFGISLEHWTQEYEFVASLKERVETRLERTIHSDDALSGRDEIWVETLELGSARPFFGYCFEPFSNYTFYSTPHQQYLEILFKTGGIGLAVFLLFFGYAALLVVQLWRRFADDIVMGPATAAIAASLLAVCIGNLTQPNFTYSVTGNFQFFILGLLLSESTIARLLVNRAAREDLKQQPRATSTTPPLKPFGSPEALRPDRPDATPTRETTASQFSGWHIHLQRQPAIVPRPQLPQSHQKSI
jgi:O-antigen ligase